MPLLQGSNEEAFFNKHPQARESPEWCYKLTVIENMFVLFLKKEGGTTLAVQWTISSLLDDHPLQRISHDRKHLQAMSNSSSDTNLERYFFVQDLHLLWGVEARRLANI